MYLAEKYKTLPSLNMRRECKDGHEVSSFSK